MCSVAALANPHVPQIIHVMTRVFGQEWVPLRFPVTTRMFFKQPEFVQATDLLNVQVASPAGNAGILGLVPVPVMAFGPVLYKKLEPLKLVEATVFPWPVLVQLLWLGALPAAFLEFLGGVLFKAELRG